MKNFKPIKTYVSAFKRCFSVKHTGLHEQALFPVIPYFFCIFVFRFNLHDKENN
ncbi:hypothetical protein CHU_3375 [Cytophaga hutchinsonii ATCC 33406]|uniref:Uncharacterized protein n=1 Tax=Cytophaga hutchinsonii (strain ATCC 33406 / DSM 1761 / CIP 103989 / NBRC 15051 / NCIMB 9469 / D465) TaxID=269798 RepID=A0A6N4SVX1_CYTH3|nr:hypothetical protein CHU_3375 [Cytophaga hutchinsonii ATCC 33406]